MGYVSVLKNCLLGVHLCVTVTVHVNVNDNDFNEYVADAADVCRNDEKTLQDCGVAAGGTIHMVLSLRGGGL
jgi:hypothetical protein